jgi:signal transduction histidine kinase
MMNTELLTRMLQLSREMAETREINQLLAMAMESTLNIVGAELCYLILLSPDGELDFRAKSSVVDDSRESKGDELSRSIFDEVVRTAEPTTITDALSDERYSSKSSIINLQVRSVMCVPLIARGEILGAIYVENRSISGAFRRDDLEPLIFFANQAAVSIQNAMIIANLEQRVAARTAELEKGWHEAVESNKMRTLFLGQLAHDMRTPASIIKLSLSTLKSSRLGELNLEQQRWLERTSHAMEQMTHLIDNIFDLSKVELNALELHKESVDLKPFLERIYEVGLALPWAEAVQFDCDLPETLPQIAIDSVRIQQVFMNLISNALKFTEEGRVVLHATLSDDTIELGVSDTGEGISEDAQTQVFERFRQFDSDGSRRTSGAGLGLAICRELVEMHDGRIWVNSTPAEGSNFVFTLPLQLNPDF